MLSFTSDFVEKPSPQILPKSAFFTEAGRKAEKRRALFEQAAEVAEALAVKVQRPIHVPQIVDQYVDVPVQVPHQVQQFVDVPVEQIIERPVAVPRQVSPRSLRAVFWGKKFATKCYTR